MVCDSSEVTDWQMLKLENVSIHNCKGYGLAATNCKVAIYNTLISNTLGDCLFLDKTNANIIYSTFAQFYPYDANRGLADA